jgi:hypothetical protein
MIRKQPRQCNRFKPFRVYFLLIFPYLACPNQICYFLTAQFRFGLEIEGVL